MRRGEKGHYHCADFGMDFDDTYQPLDSVSLPAAHQPIYVAEIPATATENGVIEHFDCRICLKHFREEQCVNELTQEDMVIPAIGGETSGGNSEICGLCGERHDNSAWGRVSALVHLILYVFMSLFGML